MSNSRAKNRPKRVPMERGTVMKVGEHHKEEGYVYRWIDEKKPGRIEEALAAGWEPVSGNDNSSDRKVQDASQLGSVVRVVANRDPNAISPTQILVKKPKEWFDEDVALKQRKLDKVEEALDPRKAEGDGNHYGARFEKTYK